MDRLVIVLVFLLCTEVRCPNSKEKSVGEMVAAQTSVGHADVIGKIQSEISKVQRAVALEAIEVEKQKMWLAGFKQQEVSLKRVRDDKQNKIAKLRALGDQLVGQQAFPLKGKKITESPYGSAFLRKRAQKREGKKTSHQSTNHHQIKELQQAITHIQQKLSALAQKIALLLQQLTYNEQQILGRKQQIKQLEKEKQILMGSQEGQSGKQQKTQTQKIEAKAFSSFAQASSKLLQTEHFSTHKCRELLIKICSQAPKRGVMPGQLIAMLVKLVALFLGKCRQHVPHYLHKLIEIYQNVRQPLVPLQEARLQQQIDWGVSERTICGNLHALLKESFPKEIYKVQLQFVFGMHAFYVQECVGRFNFENIPFTPSSLDFANPHPRLLLCGYHLKTNGQIYVSSYGGAILRKYQYPLVIFRVDLTPYIPVKVVRPQNYGFGLGQDALMEQFIHIEVTDWLLIDQILQSKGKYLNMGECARIYFLLEEISIYMRGFEEKQALLKLYRQVCINRYKVIGYYQAHEARLLKKEQAIKKIQQLNLQFLRSQSKAKYHCAEMYVALTDVAGRNHQDDQIIDRMRSIYARHCPDSKKIQFIMKSTHVEIGGLCSVHDGKIFKVGQQAYKIINSGSHGQRVNGMTTAEILELAEVFDLSGYSKAEEKFTHIYSLKARTEFRTLFECQWINKFIWSLVGFFPTLGLMTISAEVKRLYAEQCSNALFRLPSLPKDAQRISIPASEKGRYRHGCYYLVGNSVYAVEEDEESLFDATQQQLGLQNVMSHAQKHSHFYRLKPQFWVRLLNHYQERGQLITQSECKQLLYTIRKNVISHDVQNHLTMVFNNQCRQLQKKLNFIPVSFDLTLQGHHTVGQIIIVKGIECKVVGDGYYARPLKKEDRKKVMQNPRQYIESPSQMDEVFSELGSN